MKSLRPAYITNWANFRAAALAGGFLIERGGVLVAPKGVVVVPSAERLGPHLEATRSGNEMTGRAIAFGYVGAAAEADAIPLSAEESADIAEATRLKGEGKAVPADLAARAKAATQPEARSTLLNARGKGKAKQAARVYRREFDEAGNETAAVPFDYEGKFLMSGLLAITSHDDDLAGGPLAHRAI